MSADESHAPTAPRRGRGRKTAGDGAQRRQARSDGQADGKADAPQTVALDSAAGPAAEEQTLPIPTPFPIVGIGASAGGLQAFEAFFSGMPQDTETGMAYVLVQHLSPDHKSLLVELLKRYTKMRVYEAEDGMAIEPDCTYIIPPNRDLALGDGALRVTEAAEPRGMRLSIDHFFRSLAQTQRERAICIVMSGTGSDGTLGLRAVKGEGGLAIAQAPDSTEHDGMPRSAIATGMVDYVLSPAEMPAQLISYARHAFAPARDTGAPVTSDGTLKKISLLLRAHTGHDFTSYKETTLVRRIDRRMALHQISHAGDYLRYARENPPEVEALFHDLLIGVTNFFRDREAFQVLQDTVLPQMLANKSPHDPVRVWVCGCSTGEEAYSMAILLHEHALAHRLSYKIQVFATDIDSNAIEHARAGVYPVSIAADVSEQRLAHYFTLDPQRGQYRIQKHIRDLLVFSEQDVIKDPPFSKLDLVSCRNLLIYLNPDVQRRLIPLFHYSLTAGGVLFLGTSETVGDTARLFSVLDRKWKLYARLPDSQAERPPLMEFAPPLFDAKEKHETGPHSDDETNSLRLITEQALLSHYGQAAVLIDGRGEILHILGRTGKFLEPASGDAALNILPMAREGLRRELTIALHKVVSHREPVTYSGLRVKANGDYIMAKLAMRPVDVGGSNRSAAYLVVLEELPDPAAIDTDPAAADANHTGRITALEQELRSKDEYLQTTLEEMETANEELKSTNEEMQSVNEELQSTNEELETSKEELQSVNEELSTVNAQLQDRVSDLSRANNDMNNLLAGTGVGTLFVDHHLRISRFTPATTQVINLIAADTGRPLEHVVTNVVGYDHMLTDIRSVLDTLVPTEAEVQVKSGHWYLMRVRPYRTMENLIEGAVVTFVDITERKKTEESLRSSEARLHALISQAYAGVAETDLDGRVLFANERLCEMLGYTAGELQQRRMRDITDPTDYARLQDEWHRLVKEGRQVQFDKQYVHRNGSRLPVHESASVIRDAEGRPASLLFVSLLVPPAAST